MPVLLMRAGVAPKVLRFGRRPRPLEGWRPDAALCAELGDTADRLSPKSKAYRTSSKPRRRSCLVFGIRGVGLAHMPHLLSI